VSALVIVSFVSKPEQLHEGRTGNSAAKAPAGSQFYVATTGNNASSGTSPSAPWRTIQHAMSSATPGSTVNIMAGTYQERLSLNVSGTSGSYITFQPYNFSVPATGCGGYTGVTCGGDQVILDYGYLGTVSDGIPMLDSNNQSYVTIQGLTFQNYTTFEANVLINWGVHIQGSNYVNIKYNRFLNFTETGPFDGRHFQHTFWVGNTASHILVYGNELGNMLGHGEALDLAGSSETFSTLQNNWLHDVDQIGIDMQVGANNYEVVGNKLEYISVKRDGTVWFNNPAVGIYNDGGNTGVIERNFVNHAGVGIQALAEPGNTAAHDIIIRNNIVQHCLRGVVLGTWYSSTDGSTVYNIKFWNNTIYRNVLGLVIRPMLSSTVSWENNAFAENTLTYSNPLDWHPGTVGYNLYFGGGTAPGNNNVLSDPLFVNATGGDFSLRPRSPAVHAGDPNSSTKVIGATDFAGNPRIAAGRADIGAYEIQ
jgi:Protein of unknown function (DUF1565)